MLCEHCGEMTVEKVYERGGSGFVGQRFVQATDNQYLVEYVCSECGAFHGCAVEDVECIHPYPHDVVDEWIASWRFASGRVDTSKRHYPSRYYQASIWTVRCQECGETFNTLMIWHWSRDGYAQISRERDDEFYPALKAIVADRYAERMETFDVQNLD